MMKTFPVLFVLCLTSLKVSADDETIALDGFDATNPAHQKALLAFQQVLNGNSASASLKPHGVDGDIDLDGYDASNPAHHKALKEFQAVLEGKSSPLAGATVAAAAPSYYEAVKSRVSQTYQSLPSLTSGYQIIPNMFYGVRSYLPSVSSWLPSWGWGSVRSYF
ncbi:hypothetical protein WDU94_013612 [Cyamophila willieti]